MMYLNFLRSTYFCTIDKHSFVNWLWKANDRDLIKAELGMNCSGSNQCLKAEEDLVNMMVNSRTNGTATGL